MAACACHNAVCHNAVVCVAAWFRLDRAPCRCATVLPRLFRDVDKRKAELGVQSYGLSVTTLEEVFHNVSSGAFLPSGDSSTQSDDVPRKTVDTFEVIDLSVVNTRISWPL